MMGDVMFREMPPASAALGDSGTGCGNAGPVDWGTYALRWALASAPVANPPPAPPHAARESAAATAAK